MKLNIKALSLTGGILWGGAILLMGIAHLISPAIIREIAAVLRKKSTGLTMGIPS